MKEIKFRVWDKTSKEMVNINRIDIGDGLCKPTIFGDVFYDYWNDVELMQYTGIKDKNGKEIYEGDIVEYHYPSYDDYFNLKVEYKRCAFFIGDFIIYNKRNFIRVIGNIYENPELLNN